MRYLKNDKFEKKIHLVDDTSEELETVCGKVSTEDIQRYWSILDTVPAGELCKICKSGQSFDKVEVSIEKPRGHCGTCHSNPDYPSGKVEVVCMDDMKLSLRDELETRDSPIISICRNTLTVACPDCPLGAWLVKNQSYEHCRPSMFILGRMDSKWFADLKAHSKKWLEAKPVNHSQEFDEWSR